MSIKFPLFFKTLLFASLKWGRQHIIILCGCALGFFGGFWGLLVGFLTAFFIETLIVRMRKDDALENAFENPFNSSSYKEGLVDSVKTFIGDEPFDGALLVCALAVYCTGNPSFAAQQMKACFGKKYSADWGTLCRIASRSESLNGDLITECLAAHFAKAGTSTVCDVDNELLHGIFTLLAAVQYDWNYDRGEKPSVYLSELLHETLLKNKKQVDKITAACLMLGVSITDSVESIKVAHRKLVALYHPDTLGDLASEQKKIAAETFLRIQAAYENIISQKEV